tara:strand:- start:12 stop:491 length:480 start_codon:yes stop_codon:yes gene_type:complete
MHLDVFDLHLVDIVNLVGNKKAATIWENKVTDEWKQRIKHLSSNDDDNVNDDDDEGKDSFDGDGETKELEKLRREWIEAKYVTQSFLARSKRRRFSDASVLALAGIVTGMAISKKWEKLLNCLKKCAEKGERPEIDDESGVDLTIVSPWTILYNIRDSQ